MDIRNCQRAGWSVWEDDGALAVLVPTVSGLEWEGPEGNLGMFVNVQYVMVDSAGVWGGVTDQQ